MIVYPDIGLTNGHCVTLRKGQMSLPVVHDHDPVAKAQEFVAQGAEWLNITDLDAAAGRRGTNADLIVKLINSVPVPVQVGGGIRKLEHVDWWMERGADCVVIGSAAWLGPNMVRRACERYPFRIMLAVDVRAGRVMVNGWTRPTEMTPLDFARRYDRLDIGGIIVTDMDYEIDLPEASLAVVTRMAHELATPVIASGMVKTLDDLSTLKYLENIAGVVIGRALHQGVFTLTEALRLVWEIEPDEAWWRRPPPPTAAEFPEDPVRDSAMRVRQLVHEALRPRQPAPVSLPRMTPRRRGGMHI